MLKSKGIITNFQKEILSSFSSSPDSEHFYLSGGTALADFYFGHRFSYDLDLFTTKEKLVFPFSRIVEKRLKKKFSINVTRRFQTFVEFELSRKNEATRIQLAYDSPFRFAEPLESNLEIKVNDYKDIIIDKFLTFFGRTELRDAVDLFFILRKEDFWGLTKFASQKDPGFDLYWMAVALEKVKEFPDDIKRWPVEMILEVKAGDLKDKFLNLAKEIMGKITRR